MIEVLDLFAHRRCFSWKEVGNGLAKHGVSNPMGAVDGDGHQAAAQLVCPLSARFEALHA